MSNSFASALHDWHLQLGQLSVSPAAAAAASRLIQLAGPQTRSGSLSYLIKKLCQQLLMKYCCWRLINDGNAIKYATRSGRAKASEDSKTCAATVGRYNQLSRMRGAQTHVHTHTQHTYVFVFTAVFRAQRINFIWHSFWAAFKTENRFRYRRRWRLT